MNPGQKHLRIAIIGGGPAALFLLKTFIDKGSSLLELDIFEAGAAAGCGLPYSLKGAGPEHITNVSGNEIPPLVSSVLSWLQHQSAKKLQAYGIDPLKISEYKVLPRLLFGEYLNDQFTQLLKQAEELKIAVRLHLNCRVTDIIDLPEENRTQVKTASETLPAFDKVIVCSGHSFPQVHEGTTPGYFDSPYPPAKLRKHFNHAVALKGASLTAIDALRTLARSHGQFVEHGPHDIYFQPNNDAKDFKIVMYSLHGLLPGIRFHLNNPRLAPSGMLSEAAIATHIKENDGFLSLDFIFENDFKKMIGKKDPVFYEHIKDMCIEDFVAEMMRMRELADPIALFKTEYAEAGLSIERRKSVYWKEMLAALSFAINYPAKHLSAEDMLRHTKILMPLIGIVIAFVPQDSCEELLALYEAGRLEIIPVDEKSRVAVNPKGGITYHHTDELGKVHAAHYETYIDCTGQKHLSMDAFPFKNLASSGTLSEAKLAFRSTEKAASLRKDGHTNIVAAGSNKYYLKVPGIAITDSFRVVNTEGKDNPRIYMMAVPYMGGFNPDYSGLDFCETAAGIIAADMLKR